jgi:riboflavin-specific deaminase-like protein
MRPFVFINVAMTADGKIAPSNRRFVPFGGKRDHEHLLELRASADAVMAGARTVDGFAVNMGAGGAKYRAMRKRRGLAQENLRVMVSGRGTIDEGAAIFARRELGPMILLTTERIGKTRLGRMKKLVDEVMICGKRELDFAAALTRLGAERGVKRLLCEGGGELNAALFQAGLVDELHLTVCPRIFGGRASPTLADGAGIEELAAATRLKLKSTKEQEGNLFLVYSVER